MKKKYLEVIIIGIVMVLLVGTVSAVKIESIDSNVEVSNTPADNWLGRIISKIKFSIFKTGTFTIYGRELGCAEYPTEIWTFKKGQKGTVTTDPGETGFVNWFRGGGTYSDHPGVSAQFMHEDFIGDDESVSWTCDAGAYWNKDCYVEFYPCPLPCYSDSECASGEFCDKSILSQKIPNAGVCKESLPTHRTKVYRCADGEKIYLREVSYGDFNFCNYPDQNNYLPPGSGASGVCYLEENEPKICYEVPIGGSEDESTQISLTKSDLKEATSSIIMQATCSVDSNCRPYMDEEGDTNYTVKCRATDLNKQKIEDAAKEVCKDKWSWLSFKIWVPATVGLCALTIWNPAAPLCVAAAGLTVAAGSSKMALSAGCELHKVKAAEGLCIASRTGEGDICAFFEQVAFFSITGDECTDGGIIIGGGLLLIILIFLRLGGYYGGFEYNYEI